MKTEPSYEGEVILEDTYPVYWDYFYLCDGRVMMSPIQGTVADLKREFRAAEVRKCNVLARVAELKRKKETDK